MSRNDRPPHGHDTPQPLRTELLSRRGILRAAGGVALAGALGAAAMRAAIAAPSVWAHPGGLHNAGDINRAKVRVAAGTDPWYSGWQRLVDNSHSASTWTANPQSIIYRGSGTSNNYPILYNDIAAAYQNALQGVDLYSYDSRRFFQGAQYVAKYNIGQDVPFTTYSWGSGQNCAYNEQTVIAESGRGQIRPVWAMLHFHYKGRMGWSDEYLSSMYYDFVGIEGGGGDYGSTSGGYDHLGFGTLMYAK